MQPVLDVKQLSKENTQRRSGTVLAVDRVSFCVQKNEVVGLLDPHGARCCRF